MEKLNQKKNFIKREFRLSDTKLFYSVSNFGNTNEIDIPFENISGEKVSHRKSNNVILLISILIYVIAIALFIGKVKGSQNIEHYAWLFWAIVASFVLGYYFYSRENFWKIQLTNNNFIFFLKDYKNSNNVNTFIDKLIVSRNNHLKESYGFVDENLDYSSQLQNFRWLKSMNVITKQEFETLYIELKKTVKPNEKSNIGFSN